MVCKTCHCQFNDLYIYVFDQTVYLYNMSSSYSLFIMHYNSGFIYMTKYMQKVHTRIVILIVYILSYDDTYIYCLFIYTYKYPYLSSYR